MITPMWRLQIMATAALILVFPGTGGANSNPLIGRWTLAEQSKNDLACITLAEVEFTEKTVTTGLGPARNTYTVAYGRDGDSYLATAGNGQAFRVKVESGGIEANGCHLVSASSAALRAASGEGRLDAVRALLAEGADVNAKDDRGRTALGAASFSGHLDIVQALLASGADVNAKTSDGITALRAASETGHLDIVRALLAKGADVNAKGSDGATALMTASINGYVDIVEALLAKGAEVNAKATDGTTALMAATFKGHLDIVRALLAKGADVNAKGYAGRTALMAAAHAGRLDILLALLDKGAEVDAKATDGMTALTAASEGGHADIVQALRMKPGTTPVPPTADNPVRAAISPGCSMMNGAIDDKPGGLSAGLRAPSGSFFTAGDTITVTYGDNPGLTKIGVYDWTTSTDLAGPQSTNLTYTFPGSTNHKISVAFVTAFGKGSTAVVSCTPGAGGTGK